ncbi:Hypothetical protein PHPALM_6876 [Phytophthora palmivora]|uniref:Uncharacterized protein n=1 Tax=Phytophthora palmivora TaxID=4796 RepID=A0A2P4YDR1_9STRA|nr:Hypothetical protein PHPALM_6876 [Phytophthora palmivora]
MKVPTTILALATLTASVQAHGYISKPKATYEPNTIYSAYNALTTASVNKAFAGGRSEDSRPLERKKEDSRLASEMMDPIAPDYGKSIKTATPVDVTGYTEMWWQNDEYKEGFIASHEGPCEAWIDDVRIFHHDNCAAQFKTYPAKVPADYSSCKGECLFVFYWLALHEPNWQIYKQCVPITNSGSGAAPTTQSSAAEETSKDNDSQTSASTNNEESTTEQTGKDKDASDETQSDASTGDKSPSTEQSTPTPEQTEAPATPAITSAPESTTTTPEVAEAPTAPEDTPATPTVTEAITTSKCSVRRRI